MLLCFRLLSTAVVFIVAASTALAQTGDATWPDRPLKLIVPFPAGSSTDIIGRILGQRLSTRLGQQVIIDNRAGASGNIGADAVAKAAPDGYTLGIATASTHALAPSLSANLPYDPVKDFTPVGMVGGQPYALVIYPGLAAKNLGELIALAKAKPGAMNYGSAGVASLAHLAAALFASQAGITLTHVPYKSSAQSVTDMITGRLDMQFATIGPTLASIRDGKLRALVTTGAQRSSALPDVPTVAESGLPGYEAVLWVALVMPAGAPAAIVNRLNRELNEILKTADARDALLVQGIEPEPGSPEALTQRLRTDTDKWRSVVTQAGVKTE